MAERSILRRGVFEKAIKVNLSTLWGRMVDVKGRRRLTQMVGVHG